MWEHVVRLAATQHGVVSRRQLLDDLGAGRGEVAGWVRRGRLRRAATGTYVAAGAPTTSAAEVMVATLRAGPGAVAVGERLLAMQGVRDALPDGPFHVLLPLGRRLVNVDFEWRPEAWPGLGGRATVDGAPSVPPPRNLLEAAAGPADDERVRVLAAGLRRTSRSRAHAAARLVGVAPDHPGGRRVLLLGCLDLDAPESEPEHALAALLRPLGVERQVEAVPGVRVDLLLRSRRLVVEYDGTDHESGHARRGDERRDEALAAAGYRVEHVDRFDMRDPTTLLGRLAAIPPGRRAAHR